MKKESATDASVCTHFKLDQMCNNTCELKGECKALNLNTTCESFTTE